MMHGSQTLRILFSLTFMSHLYKEFSCKSIVHKTENGLEQKFAEKQLPEITEDTKQERLKQQRPFHNVLNSGQETGHVKSEVNGDDDPESKHAAMLQMLKEESLRETLSAQRRRHSAAQQQTVSECQRHDMYVNLTAIYKNFFIAPTRYNAFYCAGACPWNILISNSTKHAYIQNIMNIAQSHFPKPCCVPTKLSPISVLYMDNSGVKKEDWNDMAVEACGCR